MINNLLPQNVTIHSIKNLSDDMKLFRFNKYLGEFDPGQFIMISLPGYEEAAFSISSSPHEKKFFEIGVRKVGKLTSKMFELRPGNSLGVRGPYGHGYNLKQFLNKNITIITGGCGLVPLRSIINYCQKNQSNFKNIQIIFGAATPSNIIFKSEFNQWNKFAEILITVDKADHTWQGNTGLITNLITQTTIDPDNSVFLICGPEIMIKKTAEKLISLKVNSDQIYVSLERHIKCGFGLCQRCTCGKKYICKDGPVFSLTDVNKFGLI